MRVFMSFILAVTFCASAFAEEMTGEQVISKCYDLYRQAEYETEQMSVTISHEDGQTDEKAFARYLQFSADGEDKVRIRFFEPKLDDGLGLLIFRHREGKDEQWLRLAGEKKTRKVSIRDQGKYFAGMDVTYEDARQLVGERTVDFTYCFLPNENDGWVVEAIPKPDTKTGYTRRVFQITPKFVCAQIEYYYKGCLIKTQDNKKISVRENGRWRTSQIIIKNEVLKRTTNLVVTERNFNALGPEVFTRSSLTKGR